MVELNHLRHFYEVAKAGSFTGAARTLRISQSALSKTVALLEAREGVNLLQRSKTGVSLTLLGQQIFDQAEQIFSTVDSIQDTFRNHKEICEGILRFGASDHIANYLIAPRAAKAQGKFPKLIPSVFSATPPEIAELILKNNLEFGLSFMKLNRQGLIYEPLCDVDMAIVYHPSLSSIKKIRSKSDLLKAMGYISSVREDSKQQVSPELLEVIGENPETAFESNSQETQKRLCLAKVGFAYLARFMVEEEIQSKKLVEFPFPKPPKLTIYLGRKKNAALSFNARSFLQEIGLRG